MLFASSIFFIIVSFLATTLNTRVLGPQEYGVLTFFITLTEFTALFFNFGFFHTSSILLAQAASKSDEQELTGAFLLIALLIGAGYAFFVFLLGFFVDMIFHTKINPLLQWFSPFLIVLPMQNLFPQLYRGTNNIKFLAYFKIMPETFYVICVLSLVILHLTAQIHIPLLISLSLLAIGITVASHAYLLKPRFTNFKINLKKIWDKNLDYGIHVYWGQISNQPTYNLDKILITYFANTTQLGFYFLANCFVVPMVMLSNSLSTSLFKSFTQKDTIPPKVFQYNFLWLSSYLVLLLSLNHFAISVFFGEKFLPASSLIFPLAFAGFFQGMYQPYAFLAAKEKGVWIRNVALAEGAFNIVGNFVLIYFYGAWGAAVASAIAKCITFTMLSRYYRRYQKELAAK